MIYRAKDKDELEIKNIQKYKGHKLGVKQVMLKKHRGTGIAACMDALI